MAQHDFKVTTQWQGGRESVGQLKGDVLEEQVSIPSGLGGKGVGTNPDEMLVAAASTCYIISLAAVLERSGFNDIQITQQSIGRASLDKGKFKMVEITHYLEVKIDEAQLPKLKDKLSKLLQLADRNCMISNAIRGNVEVNIEPSLQN
ncbi:osmotically inducible protein C [Staphylococcus auricularis]|uniref:Peroxiredoxin n=1 Tax=Staphylococcus auricularis TaxID=29379 RepID=A0AAP8PP92_9STAP|nr:SACOL1771 family peroxiredoxin [Staphylococcus auricularis]PNZ67304.1 peroxiredoxin [Staphylococcus auricularis]QPT06967.1 SACOL1771 family peroxiredoxin [Staphylococcus auricularis]BCU52572.1 osmotically inducible protein C [Staphylococcus auricularis]SQJ12634.1 OsmC/Ohr family protein [Staphylococcus auricularis]